MHRRDRPAALSATLFGGDRPAPGGQHGGWTAPGGRGPGRHASAEHGSFDPPPGRPRPQATAIGAPPPDHDEGLLARLLGQHVSPELLGLWLIEVTLCAALFHILLSSGAPDDAGGGDSWPVQMLRDTNRAVTLALTFGFTSAAVGLYSPDTYLRTRGLLINTAVGALLASPAVWLVGHLLGFRFGLSDGLSPLAVKTLLAWILLLFGLRLAFSYALRAGLFLRRVLIVGDDPGAQRLQAAIAGVRGSSFKVVATLPPDSAAALSPRQLRRDGIWAVVVTAAAARPKRRRRGQSCSSMSRKASIPQTSPRMRLKR